MAKPRGRTGYNYTPATNTPHSWKTLLKWLKWRGIKEQYIYNILHYPVEGIHVTTVKELTQVRPHAYVTYGFSWCHTRQGTDYWMAIDKEWRALWHSYTHTQAHKEGVAKHG
jgi:hypothetical protein